MNLTHAKKGAIVNMEKREFRVTTVDRSRVKTNVKPRLVAVTITNTATALQAAHAWLAAASPSYVLIHTSFIRFGTSGSSSFKLQTSLKHSAWPPQYPHFCLNIDKSHVESPLFDGGSTSGSALFQVSTPTAWNVVITDVVHIKLLLAPK